MIVDTSSIVSAANETCGVKSNLDLWSVALGTMLHGIKLSDVMACCSGSKLCQWMAVLIPYTNRANVLRQYCPLSSGGMKSKRGNETDINPGLMLDS